MQDTKPFYLSRTLWVNLILGLLAIFWPSANKVLVANPVYFTTGFAVINVILRLVTKDKLSISDS